MCLNYTYRGSIKLQADKWTSLLELVWTQQMFLEQARLILTKTQFLCPHLLPSPVPAQVKIRPSTGSRAEELPRIISTKQGWSSWFRWPYYCHTQLQQSLNSSAPACFRVSMWWSPAPQMRIDQASLRAEFTTSRPNMRNRC